MPKKMPKKDKIKLPPPEVLLVKDEKQDSRFDDIHPNLPRPPSLVLIVGSVRSGKCLYEYSLVESKKGYKYIKDVVPDEYVNSKNGFVRVKDVIDNGMKKCYKIKINQNDLILTEDHKLETINGMKPLKDINEDLIITMNGNYPIAHKEYYNVVRCFDLEIDHKDHTFYCNDISVSNSNLLVNMFLNEAFYKDKFDVVKIVSTTLGSDHKGKILAEHFDATDNYDDSIIENIKESQGAVPKNERSSYALVMDDILTQDFSKNNAVSYFATRFRHYIDMYILTTQSFRAVSGLIRNNANWVLLLKQQNQKEKIKVGEEYADTIGGMDNFLKLYDMVHSKPFQIMAIDLTTNPARVLRNFTEVIYEGEKVDELDV